MKFFVVDAFTEVSFGGNPAGVVIVNDFPSSELMQKTAAELRYSETVFIKQNSENEFHLRYFTPLKEVELCGHATIAGFGALYELDLIDNDILYSAITIAGKINVKCQYGFIMIEMTKPEYVASITDVQEITKLYNIMGLESKDILVAQSCSKYIKLLPQIMRVGLDDIILPVASYEDLNKIRPDFQKLSKLSKQYCVAGVHAFTLDKQQSHIKAHCRNFAPLYGINEEAATGTATASLTYYLHLYNLIGTNQESTFIQGESMNRPSQISSYFSASPNSSVKIGGNFFILVRGEIDF